MGALIALLRPLLGRILGAAGFTYFVDAAIDKIQEFILSDDGALWVTDLLNQRLRSARVDLQFHNILNIERVKEDLSEFATAMVNQKLTAAGLSLQFSNVASKDAVIADADRFAADRLNAKAGTNFTSLKNLDREQVLTGIGAVVAQRISTATGARISNIYPVEHLRWELGTELERQFDSGVDLAPGALFPREIVARIQAGIAKKVPGYRPPRVGQDPVKAAKNRARQAKYRRSHHQIWVDGKA